MAKITEIAKMIAASVDKTDELDSMVLEVAAEEEEAVEPTVNEQMMAYQMAQLLRANTFLDKKKDAVFSDVLDLRTRGMVERAINSYDIDFLLGLGLSIETTAELAKSLIVIAKRHKVTIPNDWINVAKMNIDIETEEEVAPRRTVKM